MTDDYPRVIDPMEDTPRKLIWMLYGWLSFEEAPDTYTDDLRELARLLNYMVRERIPALEAEKAKLTAIR